MFNDGAWGLHSILTPPLDTPRSTASGLFGATLALSACSLLVGAPGTSGTLPPPTRPAPAHPPGGITWDFESGDLRGWSARGSAFAAQPTRGDNAALHPPLAGTRGGGGGGGGDAPRGRYHINTAEAHPRAPLGWCGEEEGDAGAGAPWLWIPNASATATTATTAIPPPPLQIPPAALQLHALVAAAVTTGSTAALSSPFAGRAGTLLCGAEARAAQRAASDPAHATGGLNFVHSLGIHSPPEGSASGDWPTGVLTSAPFLIPSTHLTFLIGGGCDLSRVYVELSVGGVRARAATGSCLPGPMRPVAWDTAGFVGQAARLRIVDAADSGPWGWIAVDEFVWGGGEGEGSRGGAAAQCAPNVGAVYSYILAPRAVSLVGAFPGVPAAAGVNGGVFAPSLALQAPLPLPFCTAATGTATGSAALPGPCAWYLEGTLLPAEALAATPQLRFGASLALAQATSTALIGAAGVPSVTRVTASPQLSSGQGALVRGRDWEGGSASTLLSTSSASSAAFTLFPPALALCSASSTALASGCGGGSGASVLLFDTRPATVSFSAYDYLGDPAGHDSASAAQWLARSSSSSASTLPRVTITVRAGAGLQASTPLRHAIIPVYRQGLVGSAGGSGSATLHVRWATSDGSALGVSAQRGAECLGVAQAGNASARARSPLVQCGNYISSAGEMTFQPGVRRMDIVVAIVGRQCGGGGEGEGGGDKPITFVVGLFAPGGGSLAGETASVDIVC